MSRFLAFVALSCALVACPSKQSAPDAAVVKGPLPMSEQEPNDKPDKAQRISEDADLSASLGTDPSHPDDDCFVLSAAGTKSADVMLSAIPGVNASLEVVDRDRNIQLSVNGGGDGEPERIPNLRVSGDVFVKVSAVKRGAGGAYSLRVRFKDTAKGAELEPDDRLVDAFPMGLLPPEEAVKATGLVGHAADEDWYRIDLIEGVPTVQGVPSPPNLGTPAPAPPAGEPTVADAGEVAVLDAGTGDAGMAAAPVDEARTALRVEVSGVLGVRLDVSVVSAAQAPLFNAKGKEGEALSLRNIGVRASDATVYVVVKSAWTGTGKTAIRGANPDVPYILTLSREAAGADAELEPNDELAKATPLTRGGHREGFLSPKGDIDYYVVKSEEPGLTQFQLSGVERLDLTLSVVRAKGDGGTEEMLVANDGLVKEPEVLNSVKCAPECFIKVQGASRKVDGQWVRDYENPEVMYSLTANPVAEGSGEVEPNNTPEQANLLELGKSVRGTIHPQRDGDYFKLDLSERPVKTSLTATVTGILKVDVGLYLYLLDEDGKAELVQTADRAKGDNPETIRFSAEPGVYLFVVRDSRGRESNFQDSYQLTVSEGE